jgi:hypothetical protein
MKRYIYGRRFIEERDQYRRWIDPRYRSLRLADVIAYLLHRGWTQVPPDREGALVFQEPPNPGAEGEPFYQFVPDSEDYRSYTRLMFELLTGVAEFEDRQASEVIDDILRLAGCDLSSGKDQQKAREAEVARELASRTEASI